MILLGFLDGRIEFTPYPVTMVEEYKEGISFEPALSMSEIRSSNNVDIDDKETTLKEM